MMTIGFRNPKRDALLCAYAFAVGAFVGYFTAWL